MTHALILGIGGQDGAYLARLLVARGQTVTGTTRGGGASWRLAELQVGSEVALHGEDDIAAVIGATQPAAIYDLRGPAPGEAVDGAALLDRTRALLAAQGSARLLVAGAGDDPAFDADFASAKAGVAAMVAQARANGAFAVTARLSEHASRLSRNSVAAALIVGVQASPRVPLAAPGRVHDWGWAPEYVDALALMMAARTPADHGVATGVAMTEAEFAYHAAAYFGAVGDTAPPAAPPLAPPTVPRIPGWRAFTHGRDLVRTLCEGLAAA